jgi:predicted Fe-S protein YdhL (DUF1289 family)
MAAQALQEVVAWVQATDRGQQDVIQKAHKIKTHC